MSGGACLHNYGITPHRKRRLLRLATAALGALRHSAGNSLELFADGFASSFAPFSGMTLAPDSGCTLDGMSLRYVFPGVIPEPFALSLDINLSSTTLELQVTALMALSASRLEDTVGTNSNAYFHARMCSQPGQHLFPKACSFFQPTHLGKLCPGLVPLLMAPTRQLFKPLTQDDPFVVRSVPAADPALFGEAAPLELQVIQGSPCRPDGLHVSYVKFGTKLALQVDVTADGVTVSDSSGILTTAGVGDLAGQQNHESFLDKVCGGQAKTVLPKACDFFAASHLGAICPALEPLLLSPLRVRDMRFALVDAVPADDDPFMLRPSAEIDWQSARGSPCTDLGMSLRYHLAGAELQLEVIVHLASVVFKASSEFLAELVLMGLGNLVGMHEMTVFRKALCTSNGLSFFPRACDFFAPAHLGLLCVPLQPLLKTAAEQWLEGL